MPKLAIGLALGVAATVGIVGATIFFVNSKSNTSDSSQQSTTTSNNSGVTIKDPNGDYKLFSDPSITKQPEKDMVLGNGQLVSVEYDGSKTEEGASLFYDLFYVDNTGAVIPMTGGVFNGKTSGVFSQNIMVYTSDADKRPGFMQVTTVTDSGLDANGKITGKNITLGMYPIKFEISK